MLKETKCNNYVQQTFLLCLFQYTLFFFFFYSISPVMQYDLSASGLINKGFFWGKGRVSSVCVYIVVCVCVLDLSAAPNIAQWRGWICREWSYGSSISPILNFSLLTAVTIQGLMSPHVLASPFHSPHPAGRRDSHSFSSLHKKICVCVFYPSSSSPFLSLLSHPFIPSHSTGQVRRG